MCAARNTGIKKTKGSIVIILDSDDEFVPNWLEIFIRIYQEWPKKTQVCFSQCKNQVGHITADNPNFKGFLELKDILKNIRCFSSFVFILGWDKRFIKWD